jgi:hypothetical protein
VSVDTADEFDAWIRAQRESAIEDESARATWNFSE